MAKKKASDFRYNTGETKVPWAAVGENYNAEDLMAIVKFMMKGDGEEYEAAVKAVEEKVYALDKISEPPAKLSLDAEVAKAEEMCDEFLNTEGCLFVTNCTAGFEIASKYADLKPGDEVIVPAITFAATMAYPLSIGCKIVFADVDPKTINMDPADVAKKITDKTKMIVPVHIGGYPVDMDPIMELAKKHNLIVLEECYDAWAEAMAKAGAVLLKEDSAEKAALLKTLWPESPANHDLNRQIVAQGAEAIAKAAGIDVPAGTKMLMAEENGGYGNDYPFTGEKLSPVSGIRKAKDFDDAVEKMMNILNYQGKGHSCGIHTSIPERVTKLGEVIPVCKVCVNQPQSLTNSGSWTCGFPISMTLGCGTWGHNSISHNATWKDLLNFTYVSRPIPSFQPTDEELFDAAIKAKVDA